MCVYVCVSVSALLMLSVEVLGIAEIGPFFGLKPSRSSFHFLIFPIWLLRKWGNAVGSRSIGKKKMKKEKRKKRNFF